MLRTKTTVNHPQCYHKWLLQPIKSEWFIVALPMGITGHQLDG